MPTYEYACKDCGRSFDIVQGFDEDSLTECPTCRGRLRKKFNSVGVVFKGSGFYRNDARSSSVGTDAAAPAAAAQAPDSTSSAPKESKPSAPAAAPAPAAPAPAAAAAASASSSAS